MAKEIRVKLYRYDELPEKAKSKLREEFRESAAFQLDLNHRLLHEFEEALEHHALRLLKPLFSLGYCQGDGVAFEGEISVKDMIGHFNLDVPHELDRAHKFLNHVMPSISEWFWLVAKEDFDVTFKVQNNMHPRYTHQNSFSVSLDMSGSDIADAALHIATELHGDRGPEKQEDFEDQLEEELEEMRSEMFKHLQYLSMHLEKIGYEQIEYALSDSYADEFLRDMDAWYDARGIEYNFDDYEELESDSKGCPVWQ